MRKTLLLLFVIPFFGMTQTNENSVASSEKVEEVKEITSQEVKPKVTEPQCVSGDCTNGKGEMQFSSGSYSGDWKDGVRHGQGKFTWDNGDVYNGAWVNDNRHGYGEYFWHDGSRYKGNYSHGVRSGYGIYYYANGSIYEGTWQNNLKHGIANFYNKESVNIGGKYFNNEYVDGTGITQETYKFKPIN